MRLSKEERQTVLERMMKGESLRDICRDPKAPQRWAVYEDLEEDETFANQYARASEMRADECFDEMFEIADNATPENVAVNRLKIDTRKWALSKMQPKKYGDKLAIGGADDLPPIKSEDVTPGEKVKARVNEIAKRIGAASESAPE